ncbi:MAG: diacylglycerol kinase family protein [Bacteroidetes bacterium]|nr:diacylglycerol kinase family protein [Bacteroidota bacterium]
MNNKPFSINDRIKSFDFAIQGIITFFKTQHNVWIHIAVAITVVILGFVLNVNNNEWCWLIIGIALVLISEMLNTAIEFLCDKISPEFHPQIKKVKDVSAAAVLIAVIAAVMIGLIVFLPKLF